MTESAPTQRVSPGANEYAEAPSFSSRVSLPYVPPNQCGTLTFQRSRTTSQLHILVLGTLANSLPLRYCNTVGKCEVMMHVRDMELILCMKMKPGSDPVLFPVAPVCTDLLGHYLDITDVLSHVNVTCSTTLRRLYLGNVASCALCLASASWYCSMATRYSDHMAIRRAIRISWL